MTRVLVGVIVEIRLPATGATSMIGQKRGIKPSLLEFSTPEFSTPKSSSLSVCAVMSRLSTATVWGWRVEIGPRFPHSLPLPKLRNYPSLYTAVMPAPPGCSISLIDHAISSRYALPLHHSSPFLAIMCGCTTAPSLLVTAPTHCCAATQTVNRLT